MSIGKSAKIEVRGVTGLQGLSDMRPTGRALESLVKINPQLLTMSTLTDSTFVNMGTGYNTLTLDNIRSMSDTMAERFAQAAILIRTADPKNPLYSPDIVSPARETLNLLMAETVERGLTAYVQGATNSGIRTTKAEANGRAKPLSLSSTDESDGQKTASSTNDAPLPSPKSFEEMIELLNSPSVDAGSKQVLRKQINDVLESLTAREQKVLQWRFGLEGGRIYTLEEVGVSFDLTKQRIRQIEAKALHKIRSLLR